MTDPRNIAHDKKVKQEKKHHGIVDHDPQAQPGKKPHQHHEPASGDHGPDADEPVDKTESGQEP